MKIHCISHSKFEPLGYIAHWIEDNQHELIVSRPYADEALPSTNDFDALIVLGGPQSAVTLNKHPYLYDEITCIKQAISDQKIVLGICLGAQLIGEAYGCAAEVSPEKEIGAMPIIMTKAAADDRIFHDFPNELNVIHWHNDMAGLPEQAELLAFSEGCPRQIIRYDQHVYGLQCHFEPTLDILKKMFAHFKNDLQGERFVKPINNILSFDFTALHHYMKTILDRLFH